ncbi:MAG: hypothetical protein MK132_20825 [Lentisphaerales bacterium]|nr:hypothetical protein [Lentisphaerales bacterium]
MKSLKGIFLACLMLCGSSQAVDQLIAENPMIVLKIKSFDSLKAMLPAQAQQQVMMVEMMAPYLDKTKEAVVVLTSIMPPAAYAAVPVAKGTQLNAITPALPPNLQATAQLRDGYVYLPFTGMLPQTIGKGKFKRKNDSPVQLSMDIELINKLSGPMIGMMLQQDFSAMLPQVNQSSDKLIKAAVDLYRSYILDLLTKTKYLDIDVNKKESYTIDLVSEFIAGTSWAAVCEKHAGFTLPVSSAIKNNPMTFSAVMDYDIMKPMMGPMDRYMEAIGDKSLSKMMESFYEMGLLKMVGGMSVDPKSIDMNYLFVAKDGYNMTGALDSWQTAIPNDSELGMSFTKTADKIEGQEIYKYDMGAAYSEPGMPSINTVVFAKENKLFYSSSVDGLKKLSSAKLEKGTKNGFFYMEMDVAKMAQGLAPQGVTMPVIEALTKSTKNSMTTTITIK